MLVFVLWLPARPEVWGEQQKQTAAESGNTKKPNPTTAEPIVIVKNPSSGDCQNQAQNKPMGRPPRWDIYWPNLALVVAAIGATIIALGTLRAIRSQTKELRTAAEAARISAESLKDAERAWLIGEISPIAENQAGQFVQVVCGVKNCGKTVARVLEKGENFTLQSQASDIPRTPMYQGGTAKWENGALIAPLTYLYRTLHTTGGEGWDMIRRGQQVLFVFGFVRYLDIFGREHETRYLFHFDPATNGFFVSDHPEYNKAT